MKRKLLLLIQITIIPLLTFSQITVEATYDTAASYLYIVDLENSGQKYLKIKEFENDRELIFYNIDHTIWKTISLNDFPVQLSFTGDTLWGFDILYVSENLFNLDNNLEFMYCVNNGSEWFTGIYDEFGNVLLGVNDALPNCKLNSPQVQKPIYNTSEGTKMILSFLNGQAKVYSLEGVLTIENSTIETTNQLNIFPNPTKGVTTIQYNLPMNAKQGEIQVVDMKGSIIKSYNITNEDNYLKINNEDFIEGLYNYSLTIDKKVIQTRKILIKK